jgi:DivIVA domain-containing protein
MRKRKDENDVSEPAAVAQGRLTPTDIQEKVFRSQPGLHGYNEREVDEFLDRITEELARVHAENQRLREQQGGGQGAATASVTAAAAVAGPQIGSLYIAREKEFLRSLATLIQEHAEAVRQDVRRATGSGATAPAAATPASKHAEPAPAAAAPVAEAEAAQPALDTTPRELDPVAAGADAAPQDETIRELFWGED